MKSIKEAREAHQDLTRELNGLRAVIVKTEYYRGRTRYGVQYWRRDLIKAGTAPNPDGTTSVFVERL